VALGFLKHLPQKSINSHLRHHHRLVDTLVIACNHPAVTENNLSLASALRLAEYNFSGVEKASS
jgi:hypothetical protein